MAETAAKLTPFYGPDLARAHAEGFAGHFLPAVPWLASLAQGSTPVRVADLGCGDGAVLAALETAGVPGWGCDLSQSLVRLARARGLTVELGDARSTVVPPASLVIALGEVLAYLQGAESALVPAFSAAHKILPPGGHCVFDLPDPSATHEVVQQSGPGWHVLSETDCQGPTLVRRITVALGGTETQEVHRLRVYPPDRVAELATAWGFSAEPLRAFGPAEFPTGRTGYLCRRLAEAG